MYQINKMNVKCTQCQRMFDAKRASAKFCSDKCRQASKRRVSIASGKTPEVIRDLKYKEMQGNEELPVIDENTPAEPLYKGSLVEMDYDDQDLIATLSEGQLLELEPDHTGYLPRLARIARNKERFGDISLETAKETIENHEKSLPNKTKHQTAGDFVGGACACSNCGEFFGSSGGRCARFCKNCKTAPQRELVAKLNYAVDVYNEFK